MVWMAVVVSGSMTMRGMQLECGGVVQGGLDLRGSPGRSGPRRAACRVSAMRCIIVKLKVCGWLLYASSGEGRKCATSSSRHQFLPIQPDTLKITELISQPCPVNRSSDMGVGFPTDINRSILYDSFHRLYPCPTRQ